MDDIVGYWSGPLAGKNKVFTAEIWRTTIAVFGSDGGWNLVPGAR
jgi:hypothetical protein